MSQLIFLIFAIFLKIVLSDDLVCYYIVHSDGYNCHMENTFTKNAEITTVNGTHRRTKSNSLVDVVFIPSSSETEYLPLGACNFFNNLIEYESYGVNVLEISREVFTGCEKLNLLLILNAKFSTIPEDSFEDLPNLTILEIGKTKLSYLPQLIFANNQMLIKIDLKENQLAVINSIIPPTVTSLLLLKNDCISKNFTRFSHEIYEKCSNESKLVANIPETNRNMSDENVLSLIRVLELSIDVNKQAINKIQNQPKITNNLSEIQSNLDKMQNISFTNSEKLNSIQEKIKQQDLMAIEQKIKVDSVYQEIRKLKNNVQSVSFSALISNNSVEVQSDKVERLEASISDLKRENASHEKRFEWNEILQYVSGILVLISVTFFILAIVSMKFNRRHSNGLLMEDY